MSDRIRFQCENCNKALVVASKHRGRRVACPGCGEPLVVGGAAAAPVPKAPVPRAKPKVPDESWDGEFDGVEQTRSAGRSSQKEDRKSGLPGWLVPTVVGVCVAGVIGVFGYQYVQTIAARVRGSNYVTPVAAREAIATWQVDLKGEFAGITDARSMNESIPRIDKLIKRIEDAKDSLHALVTEQIRKSDGALNRSAQAYEVELLRLAESPQEQSPFPEFEDQWGAIRKQSETRKAMMEEWNRLTKNEAVMVALLDAENEALLKTTHSFSAGLREARQQFSPEQPEAPRPRRDPTDFRWRAFRKSNEELALRIHFSGLTNEQGSQVSKTLFETAKGLKTEGGSLSVQGIGDDFFVKPVKDINVFLEKAQLGEVTKLDLEAREVWIEVGGDD